MVGAVVQRELLERKYDNGPDFLASELAYPQAVTRGLVSIIAFYLGVKWSSSDVSMTFQQVDFSDFAIGTVFLIGAWAAYGVYRTVLAARQQPKVRDLM